MWCYISNSPLFSITTPGLTRNAPLWLVSFNCLIICLRSRLVCARRGAISNLFLGADTAILVSSWTLKYQFFDIQEYPYINLRVCLSIYTEHQLMILYSVIYRKTSFVVLYHEDSKSLSCYCQILDVLCIIWLALSMYNLHFLLELLYQMTCCSRYLNYAMDLSQRRSISLGFFQVSTYRWFEHICIMNSLSQIKSTNTQV